MHVPPISAMPQRIFCMIRQWTISITHLSMLHTTTPARYLSTLLFSKKEGNQNIEEIFETREGGSDWDISTKTLINKKRNSKHQLKSDNFSIALASQHHYIMCIYCFHYDRGCCLWLKRDIAGWGSWFHERQQWPWWQERRRNSHLGRNQSSARRTDSSRSSIHLHYRTRAMGRTDRCVATEALGSICCLARLVVIRCWHLRHGHHAPRSIVRTFEFYAWFSRYSTVIVAAVSLGCKADHNLSEENTDAAATLRGADHPAIERPSTEATMFEI